MKTYAPIVENVQKEMIKIFGKKGGVIHHQPTNENSLGQSGIHTFVNDIMDICEDHPTSAYQKLVFLFLGKD